MIHFTNEEMISFLEKRSYQIIDYNWIENVSVYHNKTEEVHRTTKLAMPNDIPYENFIKGKSLDVLAPYSEWQLTRVFERELKNKILNY